MPAKGQPSNNPNGRTPGIYADDSRITRLANLPVGGTESLSSNVKIKVATNAKLQAEATKLSGTLRKAAARATSRTGFTYSTSTGKYLGEDDQWVVTAVTTRIK
jgi:hypothetical protein